MTTAQRTALATAIAVLGVGAALALAWPTRHSARAARPAGVPASVAVDGDQVPFAGLLPWRDAIVSADGRRVRVDVDRQATPKPVCSTTAVRTAIEQGERGRVQIAVAGYGRRSDGRCSAEKLLPTHLSIELTAPLGDRRLVDRADGRTHRGLAAATIPSVGAVRTDFAAQEPTWDESTGVITLVYLSRARVANEPDVVELRYGPAAALKRLPGFSVPAPPTESIGRYRASIDLGTDGIHADAFCVPPSGPAIRLGIAVHRPGIDRFGWLKELVLSMS